jgi:hypothetical protein
MAQALIQLTYEEQANTADLVSGFTTPAAEYVDELNGAPLPPGAARRYFQIGQINTAGGLVSNLDGGRSDGNELNDRFANDTALPFGGDGVTMFRDYKIVDAAAYDSNGRSRLSVLIAHLPTGSASGTALKNIRVLQFDELWFFDTTSGLFLPYLSVEEQNLPIDQRTEINQFLNQASLQTSVNRPAEVLAYGVEDVAAINIKLGRLTQAIGGTNFYIIKILAHAVAGRTRYTVIWGVNAADPLDRVIV